MYTWGMMLEAVLDEKHQQQVLTQAGISSTMLTAALTPVALKTDASRPASSHSTDHATAALVAGMLLYLVMLSYGNAVAAGVAQEKTSRTAEVLLGAIRPRQLLAGKVTGIGLCGLGQLTIVAIAGLTANAFVHSVRIPSTVWLLLPASLLWFALGAVAWWEVLLAMLLMLVAIGGVIGLTGSLYANALVRRGRAHLAHGLEIVEIRANSQTYGRYLCTK